jgi:hypothetical protein
MGMKRNSLFLLAAPGAILVASACAHPVIPNTAIADKAENREVIAVLEQYRSAVEKRDAGKLSALSSFRYFDDMGTMGGSDDMDYNGLEQGLARVHEEVLDARYNISYRRITFAGDRVWVEVLYSGWFKVKAGEDGKPVWKRRLQSHRIALARENGRYRIVSGI